MTQTNIKYCSDCGEQINAKAEICPKCGVRQIVKKGRSPIFVILLVLGLFFGIAFIGIISAVAIPQFSEYRTRGYNSAAISDLKNAKTYAEAYFTDNSKYPDSLEKAKFTPATGITIEYTKNNDKSFMILSVHKNGTKLYMTTSEDLGIYQRDKNDENAQFTQL